MKISRVLLTPALDALPVFHAVVGVLKRQSDGEILLELDRVHQAAQKFPGRVAKKLGGAERAEGIGVASAEDVRRSSSWRNPGRLITVRHHRLGFAKSGRVSADYRRHLIGRHRAFHEPGGLRLVRGVVIENFLHRKLFSFFLHHDSAAIVDLFDRQFDALALILPGLCFPARDRHHDADADLVAGLPTFPASSNVKAILRLAANAGNACKAELTG